MIEDGEFKLTNDGSMYVDENHRAHIWFRNAWQSAEDDAVINIRLLIRARTLLTKLEWHYDPDFKIYTCDYCDAEYKHGTVPDKKIHRDVCHLKDWFKDMEP